MRTALPTEITASRQQLAWGSDDRTVHAWDGSTVKCLQTFKGYAHNVFLSPDDSKLVADFGALGVR
jgi:hypothetical protein